MKWLVGLLVAGIILFLALGIIANKKYDASRKARQVEEIQAPVKVPEPTSGAETSKPEATPEVEAVQAESPAPEDALTTGTGRLQATTIIGTDKVPSILETARLFEITLLGIHTNPGGAFINATWTGDDDTPGLNFVEELKKRALITSYNLDESNVDYRFDKGEKLWTANYQVTY